MDANLIAMETFSCWSVLAYSLHITTSLLIATCAHSLSEKIFDIRARYNNAAHLNFRLARRVGIGGPCMVLMLWAYAAVGL